MSVSVCAQLLSRVQLFFNPMDFSPPASSVLGMPQARALEWVAMPSSRRFPDPGIPPAFLPLLHRQLDSLTTEPWGKDTKTRSDQSSILRSPFNLNSFLTLARLGVVRASTCELGGGGRHSSVHSSWSVWFTASLASLRLRHPHSPVPLKPFCQEADLSRPDTELRW